MIKKNKYLLTFVFIVISTMIFAFLYCIYTPNEIVVAYEGIYFDFDNVEVVEPVKISINGIVSKDLWLKPKTFTGTISINSSRFEIIKPLPFGKTIDTFSLSLNPLEEGDIWKLYGNYLFICYNYSSN